MLNRSDRSRTNYQVGTMLSNRLGQQGDIGGAILIVRIGIDNDIRPETQAGLQTRHERLGEALVTDVADNMIYTVRSGNLDRRIITAVIDDQPFDSRKPFNFTRQLRQADR